MDKKDKFIEKREKEFEMWKSKKLKRLRKLSLDKLIKELKFFQGWWDDVVFFTKGEKNLLERKSFKKNKEQNIRLVEEVIRERKFWDKWEKERLDEFKNRTIDDLEREEKLYGEMWDERVSRCKKRKFK